MSQQQQILSQYGKSLTHVLSSDYGKQVFKCLAKSMLQSYGHFLAQ